MPDAGQNFTEMFQKLGEQLKVPSFDMTRIMMASGATAVANKQREIFEGAMKEIADIARDYRPGGSPQDIFTKQAEFGKKAMEAAIANTRDIAELVQKSGTDALKIIQERMQESYEEIRGTLAKK